MPSRNWKIRIGDILESIHRIQRYTEGMTFDQFEGDDKTIDSVLRNLEILGEASRHVPNNIKNQYKGLPWVEMHAMRNIVVHEYHGVNLKIIWQTITEDLSPLIPKLEEILGEE